MADIEHPIPANEVEKRVNDVIDDLAARRVGSGDRARLKEAVNRADRPLAGRPGADAAIGNIAGGRRA